jgi:hypothetical protein
MSNSKAPLMPGQEMAGKKQLTYLEEHGFSTAASWAIFISLVVLVWFWGQWLTLFLHETEAFFLWWALFGLIAPLISMNGMVMVQGFCISKIALAKSVIVVPISLAFAVVFSVLLPLLSLLGLSWIGVGLFSVLNAAVLFQQGLQVAYKASTSGLEMPEGMDMDAKSASTVPLVAKDGPAIKTDTLKQRKPATPPAVAEHEVDLVD